MKMSTTASSPTTDLNSSVAADSPLTVAIRDYIDAYVYRHSRKRTAEEFGVSRHTLWRFLRRGKLGRSLPRVVFNAVGSTVESLEEATQKLIESPPIRRLDDKLLYLTEELEDTLLLVSATPLATASELSRLSGIPSSTIKSRLRKLVKQGLLDFVSHRLAALGPRPHWRYFPTRKGIIVAGSFTHGKDHMLGSYPVSRRWSHLLAERLDAVAVLYHMASMVADADTGKKSIRVDLYRQGPYDMLITLTDRQAIGIIRQGQMLPTANLRYRLRSIRFLPQDMEHTVTLVLTPSDQATRRAIRALGDPWIHNRIFVATEPDVLAGGHESAAWKRCGTDTSLLPVKIDSVISLVSIVTGMEDMLEASDLYQRATNRRPPNPDDLYSTFRHATMSEPSEQLSSSLAVQLTAAEKQALDLLASWPLCTKQQLEGLMGGVTRRRVNQVLGSLTKRSLAEAEGKRHVLTDDGLRFLARRDRASVNMVLGRWSASRESNGRNATTYHGSSLRTITSQLDHHDAVTSFSATITAESSRSESYEVFDLQPTSRSTIGYKYNDINYVLHPDAAFILGRWGYTRHCLLEFERRAITPVRIRAKLLNYRRYYLSGWSDRDHGGHEPLVLFVFETPKSERSFLRFIDGVNTSPLLTSNNELIKERGVLGDVWRTSASETQSRVALRAYFPDAKVQLADPGDSCREDADKPKVPSTYVVRPHSGLGGQFVAVSGNSWAPVKSPIPCGIRDVR